ncbi:glucuronyl hydrolase [Nonlabens agnitus]|uniref:Glucuronyl hydrolase n=2 Tax=Nonlabens agnitus TaxID=870484 RepID=A0A2S9WT83_9FLAO|nr:glucuronyl hydrolase [Nonlabens agnitus]
MNNFYKSLIFWAVGLTLMSCKQDQSQSEELKPYNAQEALEVRYEKLASYPVDSLSFPRSYSRKENAVQKVPSKDWTSGFYVGNLFQIHSLTGEDRFQKVALEWLPYMQKEELNDGTHDMGFKIWCSYGEAYEQTGDTAYEKVILKGAQTLSTRFNETVGSLRSWDFNDDIWEFPVIIDNMMNLELLFEATRISGDSTYHNLAVQHANTTLKNHFREDQSSVHVTVYDTISGAVKQRVTHQGLNDDSSWARGQGWAIYGYTMAYRYTKDPAYLNQAKKTAAFFLDHKNLPDDGIPYWDFNDPAIPDAPRDVSAGALVASGLVELYSYTNDQKYLDYSNKVLSSLKSQEYILPADFDAPFILDHSTGNWPKNDEIDEPIVYGDYYFLELMLRLNNLNNN